MPYPFGAHLGYKGEAAVTTDAEGTVLGFLRGLVKMMAAGTTVTASGTVTADQGAAGAEAWLTRDTWTPSLQAEETADDSDKTFTVTAAKVWQVLTIHVTLATTATVGNRRITVLFTDGSDNVIAEAHAGLTQAASLTYTYTFGINLATDFALIGTQANASLPLCVLPAGYKIRVYDSAAIDAAADDMTVRIMALERAA